MDAAISYLNSPQCLVHRARLAQRVLLGARSVYDEIGKLSFLPQGHLAAEPGADFGFPHPVALHRPLQLLLFCTGYQDQAVKPPVAAGFDQDGRFHHHNSFWISGLEFGDQLVLPPNDSGMDQGIQAGQSFRVIENNSGEFAPVESAVRAENAGTELAQRRLKSRASGGQSFMPEFVGPNQVTPEGCQSVADEALTAGQASRESDLQHTPRRRSADSTVLAISIAMVSGPTPPGTGVYAPDFSTATGYTSPPSTLPFRSNASRFSVEFLTIRETSSRLSRLLTPTTITVAPGL